MEELQTRHRKEQRDLQSRITQKKKQASKKMRKSVNDECERLESELRARQQSELAALTGDATTPDDPDLTPDEIAKLTLQVDGDDNDDGDGETNDVPALRSPNLPAPSAPAPSSSEPPISPNGTAVENGNGTGESQRKPNRQKARLARRAAEQASLAEAAAAEARDLPDLKTQERERMRAAMTARHLREVEVRADGHCLYSAVADQLGALGVPLDSSGRAGVVAGTGEGKGGEEGEGEEERSKLPAYKTVRAAAAGYIAAHGEEFVPFLEEPLADYVRKVRDTGEWGGQVELLALAATYGVGINVLQDFGRVERIETPGRGERGEDGEKEMWLGYYKHGFGLGEHYNSLRKVGS